MNNDTEKKEDGSSCGCGGGGCCTGSGKWIWVVLAVAAAGVLFARNAGRKPANAAPGDNAAPVAAPARTTPMPAAEPPAQGKALPRLVDLGAGKCIPCKMMAPILEDLKKSYAGRLDVVFIDVWENPEAGKKYAINLIPTQIFYDAQGKEVFRHEGFFAKADILAKWKELGVDLSPATK